MSTDTRKYVFSHTSIRVKDLEASVKFYTEILGMKHIVSIGFEQDNFTLSFLGYVDSVPEDDEEKKRLVFSSPGILDNWGTEDNVDFKYANGNTPQSYGFGHTAIVVDDLHKACERFDSLCVNFQKRPEEGDLNTIAFITDPDNYWIEVSDFMDL
ncbi:unnamed protein product [Rhizopus stolonifer]